MTARFLRIFALILAVASSERCRPARPANVRAAGVPVKNESATDTRAATARASEPDLFVSAVRPILTQRCAPCHEPEGKMYSQLPFDNPTIVSAHSDGILRRLKVPEERRSLERWLATQVTPREAAPSRSSGIP